MQLIFIIVSIVLFLSYASLILYYRTAWQSIPDYNNIGANEPASLRMAVIIPARNEGKRIALLLKSLLAQTYNLDLVDIIVVDDHSTDDTAAQVLSFEHPNIKLLYLKDYVDGQINAYKKKAIEIAIAHTNAELIITTDGDCIAPENWLSTLASFYKKNNPALIVMPVNFFRSNGFLEIFQSLDFMTLQGITGAAVHKKMHSMCNGANLAYTKNAFEAVNGFTGIDSIASGDDMLLMHKIAEKFPNEIHYLKSTQAIVETAPMYSWKGFLNQRIRWASKADQYDDKRIFIVLLLVYFFNVWLLVLPFIAFILPGYCIVFNLPISLLQCWLLLLGLKTVIEMFFLYPVARFFNREKLLGFFPFAQPFHIIYTVIAGWLGKFGTYKWKERKVK